MALRPNQKAFLSAYIECGSLAAAARASEVGRRNHFDWMDEPEYAEAFAEAEAQCVELLEAEARRRGVEGVAEPVIYQGQLCFEPLRDRQGKLQRDPNGFPKLSNVPLVVYKKSDNLLMFLLKSKRPEVYRDHAKVEHTGPGGAPLEVRVSFVKPDSAAA